MRFILLREDWATKIAEYLRARQKDHDDGPQGRAWREMQEALRAVGHDDFSGATPVLEILARSLIARDAGGEAPVIQIQGPPDPPTPTPEAEK